MLGPTAEIGQEQSSAEIVIASEADVVCITPSLYEPPKMLDNSSESRTLIAACSLLDSMKNELEHVQSFTDDQLTQWHSQNEVRLAQLLLFAEQARLHHDSYDRIKRAVCMLHKPLTGAIEVSTSDKERILALLDNIDNNGFCCWMI